MNNATMMLEQKFNEEMNRLSNLHQYNIRNIQNEYSKAISAENANFENSKNELMGLFYSMKQQIERGA